MLTIPQNAVRAVAYAMPSKDIRYYLNGMLVEHNGAETRLVCTDGHRLHACIVKHKDGELLPGVVSFIVPAGIVKAMVKAKPAFRRQAVAFDIAVDGANLSINMPDGTATHCKPIDGKFPDYRRVIPVEFSGECAQYNPSYMADAEAGACAWLERENAKPCFCHNGKKAGGMALGGFVAIVMPRLVDATLNAPDAAFREPLTVATKEEIAA